jgi:hypothetical protein
MGPTQAQVRRFIRGVNRALTTDDCRSGFCLSCGEENFDGVEPDAKRYLCPNCMAYSVCGIIHAAEDEVMDSDYAKADLAARRSGLIDKTAV